jgi:hypothetical protein
MKHGTALVLVAAALLVGVAVWHEVVYRQTTAPASSISPVHHVTPHRQDVPKPLPPDKIKPTDEHGNLIG